MDYKKFQKYIKGKFSSVSNPQLLMKDAEFLEIFKTVYYNVFHVTPKIYTCGVCMYEHYRELESLTESQIKFRLNMKNTIKENVILWGSDGRPYSRKSAHITDSMLKELQKKSPKSFEPVEPKEVKLPETKKEPVEAKEVKLPETKKEPVEVKEVKETEHPAIKKSK